MQGRNHEDENRNENLDKVGTNNRATLIQLFKAE